MLTEQATMNVKFIGQESFSSILVWVVLDTDLAGYPANNFSGYPAK